MNNKLVSVLISVIGAIVIPVVIYLSDHNGPSILVKLQDVTEFSRLTSSYSTSKIQVTLDGRDVSDASIFYFTISNEGGKAIHREDFDSDLIVSLKGAKYVLSSEVYFSEPNGISPKLRLMDDGFSVAPLLLNAGDRIGIKVIAGGKGVRPFAVGRIAGVKDVQYESVQSYSGSTCLAWIRLVTIPITCFLIGLLVVRINSRLGPFIQNTLMCVALGIAITITRAIPYGLTDWVSTLSGYYLLTAVPFFVGGAAGFYGRKVGIGVQRQQ